MRPEEKVILCSCLNLQDVQDLLFRKLLSEVEDWEYLIDRSVDTLLSPLVYKRIRAMQDLEVGIPDDVISILHQTCAQIIVKNTFLKDAFDKIIGEFNRLEIDVIPLKGMYLIDKYYKDFSIRQISDIDLLVRESQLAEVCQFFEKCGFEREMYMPLKAAKASETPAPYKFSKFGLVIDLHVGLTYIYDNCQFEMAEVWKRASKHKLNYLEMNPLDHLVYLFAHLVKHFDYRNCKLINFYDLCLVFEKDKIVFSELLERSELLGCERDIKDICYLLKKYFELDFFSESLLNYEPSRKNIDEIFFEILSIDRRKLELKYSPQGSTGMLPMKYLSSKKQFTYISSRIFPDREYIKCTYRNQRRSTIGGYICHFSSIFSQVFRVMKFKKVDSITPPSK